MCEYGNQVILPCPEWLYSGESGKRERGISVDSCIAPVIVYLWDHKVATRGCCCGHFGKGSDGIGVEVGPSVIIDERCNDPMEVLELINSIDPRDWTVYRWELMSYKGRTNWAWHVSPEPASPEPEHPYPSHFQSDDARNHYNTDKLPDVYDPSQDELGPDFEPVGAQGE